MQTETRTCVLRLALGACLTGPTKRLAADLHEASRLYNVCRNAVVRAWERNAENFVGPGPTIRDFSPDNDYEVGWRAVPTLARKLVSTGTQEVRAKLDARVPWNHGGNAKRVWQAMLAFEAARPCYRQAELPVPSQDARLTLTDSGYTIRFPVWSRESGRKQLFHVCRLGSRRIAPGYKRILFKIASGEWKLCGSKLHWHEAKSRRGRGHWALHLTYHRPQESLGLDQTNEAKLMTCSGEAGKPFEVSNEFAFKPWGLGDTGVLLNEYNRLVTRRLSMRNRHRDKSSGRRGHGRQRVETSIRPATRAIRELMHRFQWRLVAELIRFCARYNCGTVVFNEPTMGQRAVSWFAARKIPFDWTGFLARLKHKLWVNGIALCESEGGGRNAGRCSQAGTPVGAVNTVAGNVVETAKASPALGGSRGGQRKSKISKRKRSQ